MLYRQKRPGFLPVALLLCSAGTSSAAEDNATSLDFNAYGTLSVVRSSDERADFVSNLSQAEGAGYSDEVALGVDSRVGLQLTATFTPKLSGVIQVVSEQQFDGSYSPLVEWANVKYDVTPDLSLRVGRIVLPTFIVSDYRKVGYANHWVRPPIEVYSMVPITNNDGVDASYRLQVGDYTNTLQVFAGEKDLDMPMGKSLGRGGRGFSNTLEFGDSMLKLGFLRSNLTTPSLDGFFNLFRQFGAQGNALADRYEIKDTPIETLVLGGRYDPGRWFMMAEWVRSATQSFIGTNRAWYIGGGLRRGDFTPYVTYSRAESVGNLERERGLNLTGLPAPLQDFGNSINATLAQFLQPRDSSTLSVGTRWDFATDFSFTLQLDHVRAGAGSQGLLSNVQPGRAPGSSVNVMTAAISFVY